MDQHDEETLSGYPIGRGYGHDYMRGGEVFGGYGYADREEFTKTRGELYGEGEEPRQEGSDTTTGTEESPPSKGA